MRKRSKKQQLVIEKAKRSMWASQKHKTGTNRISPTAERMGLTAEEINRVQRDVTAIGGVDESFDAVDNPLELL